ncbi:hypothetical protein ACKS0A_03949 [Histoplasma ohiense]
MPLHEVLVLLPDLPVFGYISVIGEGAPIPTARNKKRKTSGGRKVVKKEKGNRRKKRGSWEEIAGVDFFLKKKIK